MRLLQAPCAGPRTGHLVGRPAARPCRRRAAPVSCSAVAEAPAPAAASPAPAITLTPLALRHLKRMREDNGDETLLLRMGVKTGGCSGLSYTMDFIKAEEITGDDSVIESDDFRLVCDPKSLLYLYGMQLDYSPALIGGGLQMLNPNQKSGCSCGKSFNV